MIFGTRGTELILESVLIYSTQEIGKTQEKIVIFS